MKNAQSKYKEKTTHTKTKKPNVKIKTTHQNHNLTKC